MKKSIYKSLITNPLFIYSLAWFVVIGVYLLEWSSLYPEISSSLFIFLVITSLISLLLSIKTQKSKLFSKSNYQYSLIKKKYIVCALLLFYIILIVELLKFGGIPFLLFSAGLDISRTDFGLPILTVIKVNGLSLLLTFCSISYFSIYPRKKIYILYIIMCMIPSLLVFSRSALMFNFISISIAYIQNVKKQKKGIFKMSVILILVMFVFGTLGNLRDSKASEDMIAIVGGATDKFVSTGIPHEFFWGYLYISSPLANLQNTINTKKIFDNEAAESQFLLEILPESFAKRSTKQDTTRFQINDALNTGTIFWGAYLSLKWVGMILIFVFFEIIILLTSKIVGRNSVWKDSLNVTLCALVLASIFTNPLKSLLLIPQVYFVSFYEAFVKYGGIKKKI